MSRQTDMVLRHIVRYLRQTAQDIRAEAGRDHPLPGNESRDYWRGSIDGLLAAARRIESDWIAPTGKFHHTSILRLVVNRDREDQEA